MAPVGDQPQRLYATRLRQSMPVEPITCGATGVKGFAPSGITVDRTAAGNDSVVLADASDPDGDGRTYTATYGTADDSGNMNQDEATVTVPKSRR